MIYAIYCFIQTIFIVFLILNCIISFRKKNKISQNRAKIYLIKEVSS
jgi:hypothetical protein